MYRNRYLQRDHWEPGPSECLLFILYLKFYTANLAFLQVGPTKWFWETFLRSSGTYDFPSPNGFAKRTHSGIGHHYNYELNEKVLKNGYIEIRFQSRTVPPYIVRYSARKSMFCKEDARRAAKPLSKDS